MKIMEKFCFSHFKIKFKYKPVLKTSFGSFITRIKKIKLKTGFQIVARCLLCKSNIALFIAAC